MNIILKQRLAKREHCDGIFLFSFPRKAVTHHRKGFTLVEVIVVLVILAILAAIAIPALTGYIDKAEDKKYIADARNAAEAMRAVIAEAYADGTIYKLPTDPALITQGNDYPNNGNTYEFNNEEFKKFNVGRLSIYNHEGDGYVYYNKARDLIATENVDTDTFTRYWDFFFLSPNEPQYNILNAPAFYMGYYPEGYFSGAPMIIVTYGVDVDSNDPSIKTHFDLGVKFNSLSKEAFNGEAGYRVFTDLTLA
jgi:prepilin-type N-terminal cleavage/methylation domain-containing protein